jgi:Phosphotransferase enzyme family
MGRPGDGFPRPWSVYRWIAGEPASVGLVADPAGFASGLAGFLAALHAIDASDGPPAGAHSFFRGGPLATWDEQTRQLIRLTADDIDAKAATSIWDTALASTWEQAPVWVHGDVTASNLLVAGGALHAVIDFGCAAVATQPATWSWNGHSSPVTALPHSAAACTSTRRPGPAAAAGRSGRHSSLSARRREEAATRKPQPVGSDGGTAHARLSASSSPTTPIGRALSPESANPMTQVDWQRTAGASASATSTSAAARQHSGLLSMPGQLRPWVTGRRARSSFRHPRWGQNSSTEHTPKLAGWGQNSPTSGAGTRPGSQPGPSNPGAPSMALLTSKRLLTLANVFTEVISAT